MSAPEIEFTEGRDPAPIDDGRSMGEDGERLSRVSTPLRIVLAGLVLAVSTIASGCRSEAHEQPAPSSSSAQAPNEPPALAQDSGPLSSSARAPNEPPAPEREPQASAPPRGPHAVTPSSPARPGACPGSVSDALALGGIEEMTPVAPADTPRAVERARRAFEGLQPPAWERDVIDKVLGGITGPSANDVRASPEPATVVAISWTVDGRPLAFVVDAGKATYWTQEAQLFVSTQILAPDLTLVSSCGARSGLSHELDWRMVAYRLPERPKDAALRELAADLRGVPRGPVLAPDDVTAVMDEIARLAAVLRERLGERGVAYGDFYSYPERARPPAK